MTGTVVACLTPSGTAALATVALVGPGAWQVVRQRFRPAGSAGTLPELPAVNRVWFGRFGTPPGDETVVVLRRQMPMPWVELHIHGGRQVVDWALDELRAGGVETVAWPVLSRMAGDSPLRTATAVALSQARTTRTASILLDQYHGAFERTVVATIHDLDANDNSGALERLNALCHFANLGRHLTTSWRVVVAGAPNAGKSSLVNALAGYHRSVVTPTPGTTRDVVTTALAIEGWPVELTDTAGLRSGTAELEAAGIRQARAVLAEADLCLWILDGSAEPVWPEQDLSAVLPVVNKCDLAAAWDHGKAAAPRVSAVTGEGLPELCRHVSQRLVPEVPSPGTAVPFTVGLATQIEAARDAAVAGRTETARRILQAIIEEAA